MGNAPLGQGLRGSGSNARRAGRRNESLVVDLVRRKGPVSRAGIAERLDLEFQTVSNICARLLAAGVLLEDGVVSKPHRRARALVVNAGAVHAIGAELSRAEASIVLIAFDGVVLGRRRVDVADRPVGNVLDDVASAAKDLVAECGVDRTTLAGVGMSVPGPVDRLDGRILAPPNFRRWEQFPVKAELSRRLDLPVHLENTAISAALGEHWLGSGNDVQDFVYVYVGSGVGLGIVANGQAVHGARGNAGEFGHQVMDPAGPRCTCGQRGCLVQYATPRNIVHRLRQAARDQEHLTGEPQSLPANATDALAPDAPPWMRAVIDECFAVVGRATAGLARLLDPERLILGGPATELFGEQLLRAITDELGALPALGRTLPDLQLGAAGADAGPLGAASLPLHARFSPA